MRAERRYRQRPAPAHGERAPAPRLSICAHARVCEPRARVTAGVINPDSPIAQRYLSIPHISLGRGGAMRKFGEF